MGARGVTVEGLVNAGPAMLEAGVRRIEYAEDGTVSSISWYPKPDTEPSPDPGNLHRPAIPPPAPIPRESGTRLTAADPHPELIGGTETVRALVDAEIAWLRANGRAV